MNISARSVLKVLTLILLFSIGVMAAYTARRELIWIATAFFIAVALNPAVDYISRFMPKRSRGLAAGSVFLVVILLFAFLLTALVPPLVKQSDQLIRNFPRYTDQVVNGNSFVSQKVRDYKLVDRVKQSQDQIVHYASSAGGSFIGIVGGIFSSFAAGLTIFILSLFMLLEGPSWVSSFWKSVPASRRKHAQTLAGQMYDAVTGYVTGNLLTSLLAIILTASTLAIIRVPYAIPLGIIVGLFDLLPLVGATIGAVIVVLAALFVSPASAIIMVIFFTIYQQIENHILQPLIYGRTVQMSPLLVLVSVLIGAGVGGILGAIVAVPVGASVQILVRDLAAARQSSTKH